jgi:AcrR family transcriptional regulator
MVAVPARPVPVRPPRQARSRATLDRLLAAAEGLLAEKQFEGATVSEIVARAGSSVGAFYTRFPDKRALLECFDERFFAAARAQWDALLDPGRWKASSLSEIVAAVVRVLVRKHRANRPLLRALALYYRSHPDPRFRERAARTNAYVLEKLRRLLRSRPGITHPRPALAVGLGLQMVASAVREQILFEESYAGRRPGDERLARELCRAWLAYLGARDEEPQRTPR